jgi:hypothetical protein
VPETGEFTDRSDPRGITLTEYWERHASTEDFAYELCIQNYDRGDCAAFLYEQGSNLSDQDLMTMCGLFGQDTRFQILSLPCY